MIELEEILSSGEIEIEGRLVDASNATLLTSITFNNQSRKAIYKPISGERPLWDFNTGNLASRERAAYLISKYSGLDLVPLTILRDGPFGPGMVQEWIEIDLDVDLALYFKQEFDELRKVALFDAIINNTDRKIGHLLPNSRGELYVCDHGVTFHEKDKLRTVLWQWAADSLKESEIETLTLLRGALINSEIQELKELLSNVEYLALIGRIEKLLAESRMPSPNPEWPSVPWPPF